MYDGVETVFEQDFGLLYIGLAPEEPWTFSISAQEGAEAEVYTAAGGVGDIAEDGSFVLTVQADAGVSALHYDVHISNGYVEDDIVVAGGI